jgi:hypothetical protein
MWLVQKYAYACIRKHALQDAIVILIMTSSARCACSRYFVCKVIGVKDGSSEYSLETVRETGRGRETVHIPCRKKLYCMHATDKRPFPINLVSNKVC